MTYYAFIEDNRINGKGQCRCLNDTVQNIEVSEEVYNDIDRYIWNGAEIVLDPDYEEKQAQKREVEFKKAFFNISNFGWYRKQPKGYTSAVESLNTAFNAVTIMGSLPANMLIFYEQPDFTKPEECTEEWLVQHQIYNQAMTAQQFGQFYVNFMTAWNNEEHNNEL